MRKKREVVLGEEMLEGRAVMSLFGGGSFLGKIADLTKYTPAGFIASKIPTNKLPGGEYVKTAQGLVNPLGPGGVLGVDKVLSGSVVKGNDNRLTGRGELLSGDEIRVKQAQGSFVYGDEVDGKEVLKSARASVKTGAVLGNSVEVTSEAVLMLKGPDREVKLELVKSGEDVNRKGVLTRAYRYKAVNPSVTSIDGESGVLTVKLNRRNGSIQMQFEKDQTVVKTDSVVV